ncbi:hypothetical protein ACFVZC_03245 [Streptomyces marokkonensis]|uniref:Uncharacterized protein n=1 Tax=Streptomyces marokkonensis TaxID=324855 RepID=A0ABW6PZT7_9ACTN
MRIQRLATVAAPTRRVGHPPDRRPGNEILADLWEFEAKPAGLQEAGARVLPWAFKEGTGAFLYWSVRPGQHPDDWTVLHNEGRGPL